ncbi:histidinol-phosphatase [Plebeiibacterium marinum]|uniref:Histidinol-phosphatase n=1 Tax=Plebeiibacterium marinum TaxID=2992111 RepID=A0AAE3SIX9_9BACT|nr:histidinol-phosphatase [Plebeiobacterium marinum]MCW3804864.1 histidinol-phosphatase [Plebeiobacterium marinum]
MMWTNYHAHCNYCDGYGKMEEFVLQAIKDKMPVIGFSSHAPVPFDCFWTMKMEKLPEYIAEIELLKKKYSGEIQIHTSLELDYLFALEGFNKEVLDQVDLDYKIGSVHFVELFQNGKIWGIDDVFENGFQNIFKGDIKKLVKRFYQLTREMIIKEEFDIIGHFDKIKMHNINKAFFDESEDWYIDEVKSVLKLVAEKEVIVEINTKSYEKNGLLFPGVELFPLLKEYDIPLTVNSDAHYPDKQMASYSIVAKELLKVGYTQLKEFKDGKWRDIEFNEEGLLWKS